MKKTIHQVAFQILKEFGHPMTASEVYQLMVERSLYEFNSKKPSSVVRTQLRRHSINNELGNKFGEKLFKQIDNQFDVA